MAARDRRGDGIADEEGFLGRWSRRKAEARATPADNAAEVDDDVTLPSENGPAAGKGKPGDAAPGIDPATLPDIDKMGPGSDFSMFMQAGVPPTLKAKALRKLWRVKPELANLDGLLDYGEDLTGSFKIADHLQTAYRVGKGFLRDDKADEDGSEDIGLVDGHEEEPTGDMAAAPGISDSKENSEKPGRIEVDGNAEEASALSKASDLPPDKLPQD